MYLNNTNPFKVIQQPSKNTPLAEVEFTYPKSKDSKRVGTATTQVSYMSALEFRGLELGRKLQAKLSTEEMKELENFIEEYAAEGIAEAEAMFDENS